MEILLKEMRTYAKIYHVPIIKDEAAEILCRLAKGKQPQHILEIGAAIGYSTLLLAQSAPHAQITTLEIDETRVKKAREFWQRSSYNCNITLLQGDAEPLIKSLRQKIDFVFIDAAKGQYPHYLDAVMPLLSKNAVIAADNVLFRGYVESTAKPPRRYKTIVKRLREYIKKITEAQEFSTKIYREGDGLAVSQRTVPL